MLGKYDFHINDDDTKINLKVDTPNDRYLLNYIRLKIIDKSPPPPKFDNKGTKIWQGANTESNNQLIINNNLISNLSLKPNGNHGYLMIVEGLMPYNTTEGQIIVETLCNKEFRYLKKIN